MAVPKSRLKTLKLEKRGDPATKKRRGDAAMLIGEWRKGRRKKLVGYSSRSQAISLARDIANMPQRKKK